MKHLADVCCARLPPPALRHLGGLRARVGVTAVLAEDWLWLFWPAGDDELTREVLAVEGAVLYRPREGHWFRLGSHVPVGGVPEPGAARPLAALLFPAPLAPTPPGPPAWAPVRLGLVRDGTPRPTTALRLALAELARWAEDATTHDIESLRGAWCAPRALLVGGRLPSLPGERFWGKQVLVPLGLRPAPDLGAEALRAALRLGTDELAVWTAAGVEVVPGAALAPLTRAGVRLAGEAHPA